MLLLWIVPSYLHFSPNLELRFVLTAPQTSWRREDLSYPGEYEQDYEVARKPRRMCHCCSDECPGIPPAVSQCSVSFAHLHFIYTTAAAKQRKRRPRSTSSPSRDCRNSSPREFRVGHFDFINTCCNVIMTSSASYQHACSAVPLHYFCICEVHGFTGLGRLSVGAVPSRPPLMFTLVYVLYTRASWLCSNPFHPS